MNRASNLATHVLESGWGQGEGTDRKGGAKPFGIETLKDGPLKPRQGPSTGQACESEGDNGMEQTSRINAIHTSKARMGTEALRKDKLVEYGELPGPAPDKIIDIVKSAYAQACPRGTPATMAEVHAAPTRVTNAEPQMEPIAKHRTKDETANCQPDHLLDLSRNAIAKS
ncbi:hypothetical protein R1flu_026591 [Riccia fluitans]|uniref:Uncharacterized protein n=1 Tax=Riccia fluitans TaxID=41844 RepID=A0ABD1XGC6_9MARC